MLVVLIKVEINAHIVSICSASCTALHIKELMCSLQNLGTEMVFKF